MQKGFARIVAVLIFAIFFGGLGFGFYKGYLNLNIPKTESQNQATPSSYPNQPLVTPTPVPSKNYSKRQFKIEDKFFKRNYPTEVISSSEEHLVGMDCSPQYLDDYTGKFTYYQDSKAVELTDEDMLGWISEAKSLTGKKITGIKVCKTEGGQAIIVFSIPLQGGGAGTDTLFTVTSPNEKLMQIAYLPSENWAYFTCHQPLQLTKDNILYYQCMAGDGGSGAGALYRVNIAEKTIVPILKCTSQVNNEGTDSIISCE